MRRKICSYVLAAASLLILTAQVHATIMLQLNLEEMTGRADKIFRGTVINIQQSTIEAGGAELPTVTYRLRVEELFKGQASEVKGEKAVVQIRMIGSIKPAPANKAGKVKFSAFRDVPRLVMGGDYLLFTTSESSIGLSTTVGLGQGAFKVGPMEGELQAVNEFNNAGLGLNGAGPVEYVKLGEEIRALLGQ